MSKRSFWFFEGAERIEPSLVLYKLLSGFRVKLLVIYNFILQGSKIFISILCESNLLFFLQGMLYVFMMDIFIFNLNDILFVLIDYAEEFTLDFGEVLSNLVFVEEEHLLFYY